MSLDGKVREQISGYPGSYHSDSFLDPEQRYLLLRRYTEYCECDARHPLLYGIYDRQTNELTRYPVELTTSYRGKAHLLPTGAAFFMRHRKRGKTCLSVKLRFPSR